MKEVFLLKSAREVVFIDGTASSVLKNGDFFRIRDFIKEADRRYGKKAYTLMLHSHPNGFENLSQADVDTMIGLRLGLDRNFICGIVTERIVKLFRVKLWNKQVYIQNLDWLDRVVTKLLLRNLINELRDKSNYL